METSSSSGTRAVRCVNTKTLKEAAQHHSRVLGVILHVASTHRLLSFLRETSYLAAAQTGTLSAATVHFKDTWESAHIRLWPYITTNPFDVTLPRAATTVNTQAGEKKTFFSPAEENARCLSRWSLEGEKQNNNNKMRLINLDLPTRRSFVCVAGHVCHWWNTATGNICCRKLQNVA